MLGIDAHLNGYQVCRKIDAGGLQPVQSFGLQKLLLFGYKQLGLAEKVYAVYEAGPLGYMLYALRGSGYSGCRSISKETSKRGHPAFNLRLYSRH